jgi:hypothetical protein
MCISDDIMSNFYEEVERSQRDIYLVKECDHNFKWSHRDEEFHYSYCSKCGKESLERHNWSRD